MIPLMSTVAIWVSYKASYADRVKPSCNFCHLGTLTLSPEH